MGVLQLTAAAVEFNEEASDPRAKISNILRDSRGDASISQSFTAAPLSKVMLDVKEEDVNW